MAGFSDELIDPEVIDAARAGDRGACAGIYTAYKDAVYSLALRISGDRQLALEWTQDAFIDVLTRIGSFRGDGSFAGWLRQVALNRCLMGLRRLRAAPETPAEAQHAEPAAPDIRAGDERDLETALRLLPATARTVLVLHEIEGFTHAEIARLFGRSESFSKSQLARALIALQQMLATAPHEAPDKADRSQRCNGGGTEGGTEHAH